jgi:F-type H+-transporting ATPase subunit delta
LPAHTLEALFRSAKPAELSAIAEQLEELAQVASNPDLLAVANNPKLADADLLQILLGGMKTKPADIVKNFVEVLTHNNRLLAMPEIAAQFTALKNAQEGAAEVLITSAFPAARRRIKKLVINIEEALWWKRATSYSKCRPRIDWRSVRTSWR